MAMREELVSLFEKRDHIAIFAYDSFERANKPNDCKITKLNDLTNMQHAEPRQLPPNLFNPNHPHHQQQQLQQQQQHPTSLIISAPTSGQPESASNETNLLAREEPARNSKQLQATICDQPMHLYHHHQQQQPQPQQHLFSVFINNKTIKGK